jgi:hypothetical protein
MPLTRLTAYLSLRCAAMAPAVLAANAGRAAATTTASLAHTAPPPFSLPPGSRPTAVASSVGIPCATATVRGKGARTTLFGCGRTCRALYHHRNQRSHQPRHLSHRRRPPRRRRPCRRRRPHSCSRSTGMLTSPAGQPSAGLVACPSASRPTSRWKTQPLSLRASGSQALVRGPSRRVRHRQVARSRRLRHRLHRRLLRRFVTSYVRAARAAPTHTAQASLTCLHERRARLRASISTRSPCTRSILSTARMTCRDALR